MSADKAPGRHALWDIPTRVFHWSLVVLLPLAWVSAETQNYEVHEWTGYTILALVLTRLLWGLVGSRHSRFADFLTGPRRILAHLRGTAAPRAGHNPLGGWNVIAMLVLLLLQAVSGLFNNDDIMFEGPLYYAADAGLRDAMGEIHEIAFNVLLGLVALHLLAVLYHQFRRHEKLIQAMWFGRAEGREGTAAPARWWLALLLLVIVALALWWGLEQAPQPPPSRWGQALYLESDLAL